MNLQDFLALSFFFSCINIFDSSIYKMYVLIQFVLLCQMLSDLRTGYSRQGDCCCREDMSRRQSRRKEVARNKEKENEEAKMKKEKKKLRVGDLNRSIAVEA